MNNVLNLDDVKVLIFDFGGVLINLNRQRSVNRLIELGITDADKLLNNYVQSGLFLDLESGTISPEEFRDALRRDYNLSDVNDDMIDEAFILFLLDIPETKLSLLRRLKKSLYNKSGDKIRIVMLSNTNGIHFPYCIKNHFEKGGFSMSDYFDKLYLSYEMKLAKPDERIFLQLLKEEGVDASNCLFLDDGKINIDTADKLGFQTYHVVENEDLTKLFDFK